MEPLTTAELRALHALARYETATEAARAAGLSPQTLRNQSAKAYQKLGVNGRVEAFRKMGWLRPPRFMPSQNDPDPLRSGWDEEVSDADRRERQDFETHAAALSRAYGRGHTAAHNARARKSARP